MPNSGAASTSRRRKWQRLTRPPKLIAMVSATPPDPGGLPPRRPRIGGVRPEWSAIDFSAATMQVRRVKSGKPSTHTIRGDELRELRKLRKDQVPSSAFVFVTERGGPFTTDSFNWMVKCAGQKAKLPFQVHAHILRHSADRLGQEARPFAPCRARAAPERQENARPLARRLIVLVHRILRKAS